MSRIISVHSFRGGTGKSNTTANVASLLAAEGRRIAVVDTDIQSPGIHVLFGLDEDTMNYSLNDYLRGECEIREAAYDVTSNVGGTIDGQIFLIPSSIKSGEIMRVLKEGYDVGVLNDGFNQILTDLDLDALVIDTHPGMGEETLLSIAMSDSLAIILRPDQQDYQGTGVTVEVARKLDVPNLFLVINKVPSTLDFADVKARVEETYNCEVAAVLPHSDEMMTLASAGIFVVQYPKHQITEQLRSLAHRLMD